MSHVGFIGSATSSPPEWSKKSSFEMPAKVWFTATASTVVEVEADDVDKAIYRAYEKLPGSLCHQCARDVDLADEWDPDVAYDGDKEVWTR